MSPRARLGRLPTRVVVLVVLVALALPAVAVAGNLRSILGEVEGEVMCPVCGELLELAESPQATREKAFIEKLAKEGQDKAEIKEALVRQYGDAVLALPKGSGFSLTAYIVPIVGFIVAAIALGLGVWRWRVSTAKKDKEDPKVEGPSDEDRERLDADLARYDL